LLRKRGTKTGKGKDQGIGNKGRHKQSVGLSRMEERMSRFSTCNPESLTWVGKKVMHIAPHRSISELTGT
jgi:hypothetical protein